MDKEEIRKEIYSILNKVKGEELNIDVASGMLFGLMESNWSAFDYLPVYSDDYVD